MTNPNVKLSRHRGISDSAFALLLICPALLVLGVTVLFPILKGIYVSFCDYKLSNLNAPVWNHFQNYSKLFRSGSRRPVLLKTVFGILENPIRQIGQLGGNRVHPLFYKFLFIHVGSSYFFILGSRTSRMPSPNRLKPITVIRMHKPASVAIWGAVCR